MRAELFKDIINDSDNEDDDKNETKRQTRKKNSKRITPNYKIESIQYEGGRNSGVSSDSYS